MEARKKTKMVERRQARPGEGSMEAHEAATAAAGLDDTARRREEEASCLDGTIMNWQDEMSASPEHDVSCL